MAVYICMIVSTSLIEPLRFPIADARIRLTRRHYRTRLLAQVGDPLTRFARLSNAGRGGTMDDPRWKSFCLCVE
jgi:hypothetical protein